MCLVVYLSGDDNVDNVSGCISSISFDVRLFVAVKQHSYCHCGHCCHCNRRKQKEKELFPYWAGPTFWWRSISWRILTSQSLGPYVSWQIRRPLTALSLDQSPFLRGERELIVYVGFSTQNPTLSESGSSFSFPCGRSTSEQSPPPAIGWMGTSIEVRPIDCNDLKFVTGSRSTDPIVFARQIS